VVEQLTFGMESSPGKPIRNIYYGTCSWTDPTLLQSKAFYPSTVTSAAARLSFYAQAFPLVEVDSTFYAPPSEENAIRWAQRTPNGFLFNIKAYGLLTHHAVAVRSLPLEIRRMLKIDEEAKTRIYMHELPTGAPRPTSWGRCCFSFRIGSSFRGGTWITYARHRTAFLGGWRSSFAAANGWRRTIAARRCRCSRSSD